MINYKTNALLCPGSSLQNNIKKVLQRVHTYPIHTLSLIKAHTANGHIMYKAIKYYVSDHALTGLLLHAEGCQCLPPSDSRAFIGSCYSPKQALTVSAAQYNKVNCCPLCISSNQQSSIVPVNIPGIHVLCNAKKPTKKSKEKVLKAVRHFPL